MRRLRSRSPATMRCDAEPQTGRDRRRHIPHYWPHAPQEPQRESEEHDHHKRKRNVVPALLRAHAHALAALLRAHAHALA
jgi:hypothetical protein